MHMEKYSNTKGSTIGTHLATVESYSGAIEHTIDKTNQSHTKRLRQSSWVQLGSGAGL